MYLGNNAAIRGCQEYFNRCAAAGSPIGATQTPTAYDNAASFNGSNQFLSVASNSTLTVTGTSFTYAFWANTPSTSNGMVISKTSGSDTREFQISLNTGGVAEFRLFPDGTFANSRVISSSASSFPANSWNFFAYRYDSSAATIGISINGGAFTSLGSIPAITQTNTNPLNLGVFVNTSGGLNYTGQLASVGFWKRALTASEVTQLRNNGAGRTYASLDSGLRTNLISWWALNGTSSAVSLTDSHTGGNNLTNTGSVTAPNIGPVVTALSDPRQLIVDFAQGIDRLGLWNSMVCWPLRSSQNAASGSTAFSLGGLGRFDGTLIGSPSRGANGMVATTSNSYVQTTVPFNYATIGAYSGIGVGNIPSGSNMRMIGTNAATNLAQATTSTNGVYGTFDQFGSSVSRLTNHTNQQVAHWVNITKDANNSFVGYINNDSGFSSTATTLGNSSGLSLALFGSNGTSIGGVYPFFAWINTQVSSGQNAALYALYRQTLGLGLGLP
jgi:hypothetical protein